jgi:hypothetical protein
LKSKANAIAAVAVSMAMLTACGTAAPKPSPAPSKTPAATASQQGEGAKQEVNGMNEEALLLYQFITSKLSGASGVYTNLIDTDQAGEAATGHEILSESASLMMRYAVRTGNEELFAAQWELAKQTFDMAGGFSYRYSPKLQKRYPVNAAVDDLRLIQALQEAGKAFKNGSYTTEADQYGQRFYKNNVKNGYMHDFYDENYKKTNKFVTLCYINLSVLQTFSTPSVDQANLLHNMQEIQTQGYLSDEFPFYETRFDYETGRYSSENINTVESLLTILALTEAHQQKPASIRYIKEQVENGTLYGQYTREGTATNDIRSTAIYAITAMIGSQIGDKELYRRSVERMNEFQVQDAASDLYGGFGDTGSGQAYSFDNLMALLAYTYATQQ